MQEILLAMAALLVACAGLVNAVWLRRLCWRVEALEKSPIEVQIRLDGGALITALQNARRVA